MFVNVELFDKQSIMFDNYSNTFDNYSNMFDNYSNSKNFKKKIRDATHCYINFKI